MFRIQTEFLDKDPEEWESMPHYQRRKQVAKSLKVVNDVAERGVALIQNFNGPLTKHEEQKQYLLQVVEDHRKKFSDTKKIITSFKETALVCTSAFQTIFWISKFQIFFVKNENNR